MAKQHPTLSIVIPALNEAAHLPYLLQDLNWQKNTQFEVIVVDGGSHDQTVNLCHQFAKSSFFKLTIAESKAGRAIQLNKGATLSIADDLLFLHADSRLRDSSLLANAQKYISRKRLQSGNSRLCGHFPLTFSSSPGNAASYFFYESKTHLNKPDCINGDQGFWIAKTYFNELGCFDESLPYMEDARLAQKIGGDKNWLTLPGNIETSARRFESEGFANRQILNSFLCNFNAIGEAEYFRMAGNIYKQQDQTNRLKLKPFLKLTHQYMLQDGIKAAVRRWYQTGSYMAGNAWQLAFAIDCLKNKKQGMTPNAEEVTVLEFYDKYLARVTNWPPVKLFAGIIAIIWFYSLFIIR